jgi:hypothetical protein
MGKSNLNQFGTDRISTCLLYLCRNQSLCRLPLRGVSVLFVRLEIVKKKVQFPFARHLLILPQTVFETHVVKLHWLLYLLFHIGTFHGVNKMFLAKSFCYFSRSDTCLPHKANFSLIT